MWKKQGIVGMTEERFQQMFLAQNGACKICGASRTRRLAVDHCHKTKQIRGLLCSRCNTWIGSLEKEPDLHAKAVAYLAETSHNR